MKQKKCPQCSTVVCETDGTEICFILPDNRRMCIEYKKKRYETIKCDCGATVKIHLES